MAISLENNDASTSSDSSGDAKVDSRSRPERRRDRAGINRGIERLSHLSAGRGKDAYADIPWDNPHMKISASDSRLGVPTFDPLASSDWYRSLSPERKNLVGAWKWASGLTFGWHFENLMQQSMLHRALYSGHRQAEFRYIYHEIIEESQHTLMFSELIKRLGISAKGTSWWLRRFAEISTPLLAKHASPAFFVLVLCGEEPIDRYQRRSLADGIDHPLIEAIIRIHVAEEARHVSYARLAMERDVSGLGWVRRQVLGIYAAITFAVMARLMLVPSKDMARALGVPHETLTEPYRSTEGKTLLVDSVAKPRLLLKELGVLNFPASWLWKVLGLGGDH
jgi:hypothetical protein